MPEEKDMRFPYGESLNEYSNELFRIISEFQETFHEAMCQETKGGLMKALTYKVENCIKKFNEMRKKEIELNSVNLPVKFSHANFAGFYLKGANLRKAVCEGADFNCALLDETKFQLAQCRDAKFTKASLKRADFSEARVENADFSETKADGIIFNDGNCRKTDFTRMFAPGAFFVQAHCIGANFWKGNLRGANFSNAHCENADFSDILGEEAKFWKIRGKDANFGQAKLDETDFSDAFCEESSFYMASLKGADFSDARCHDADFSSANCQEADFTNTGLRNCRMDKKTNLYQCWFYGAEIEGSKLKFAMQSFFRSDKELIPFPEERDALEAKSESEAKEKLEESRTIYLDFKNYLIKQGMYSKASEFFIREREMNRALIKYRLQPWKGCEEPSKEEKENMTTYNEYMLCISLIFEWIRDNVEDGMRWFFYTVLYHFGRYGEKPHYIVFWSSVGILIFAILYGIGGGVEGADGDSFIMSVRNYIYFSIVTFTTLGYGDMRPLGWWRILAGIEAVFGAFSMAYFVVSWMRKVTR